MVDDKAISQADSALVQFGIFDWIDRNQLQLPDLYEQRLQCLEYADEAGFYCYHLAEHQATPLAMAPSPSVFLAAAIQRTHHIHLGPLVYLLPLYNPLRLAQEICMLDNMSRGRLEVGVGRGVSPYELAFYNVSPQEARLGEGLHIVGSPDTVKQQVQEHVRLTGSNYFVGSFCFGSLSREQTLRSLRLFAQEVMPACRRTG
jgi:alkanesulfonate monooxygenase SsuD/methylene tetrahydromethanopterin reductase-like flavin-dependent oxidoreductase (luciferase family)